MKYFIIVASKDHVDRGVEGGFAQAGHGKDAQLKRLEKGDWVIYYSPKDRYEDGKTYRKFTAIGQVKDKEPFQVKVSADFIPWRRKVNFYGIKELEIRPLLDELEFIANRKKWGLHLRSGFVKINAPDFRLIAEKMLVHKKL